MLSAHGSSDNSSTQVTLKINGVPLPPDALRNLLEVSVQEHLEGPSAFTLRFALQRSATHEGHLDFDRTDGDLFDVGGEVEIQFGNAPVQSTLIYGDISRLDFNLGDGELPSFGVHGYDRRHRMLRGTEVHTFTKARDSDIAAQIALKHRLTPAVVDSRIQHDSITQNRQSDFDFLAERAANIGYEVLLMGKVLHFRPRPHDARASLTLGAERDLLDFSVRLSASKQPSEVRVIGWDPLRKERIIGTASRSVASSMGALSGPELAHQAFGEAILVIADQPVSRQEEADRLARERLEQLALGFMEGDGRCRGRTDLRAGTVVELQGVGRRFSGTYYVTSTTHTFAPERGYTTSFAARRNAT